MLKRDNRLTIGVMVIAAAVTAAIVYAQTPIGSGHRLGWDQAATAAELKTMSWAIVVDGTRSALSSVACVAAVAPNSFTCTVPFPALTPGLHAIEIIAIQTADTQTFESARSAPLGVQFILVATPSNVRAIGPGQPVP